MVTHDPMAAAHSDRVVLMEDGRSVGELNDPTVDTVVKALRGMGEN
jgi:putative ABC transport system ATP-binding protein